VKALSSQAFLISQILPTLLANNVNRRLDNTEKPGGVQSTTIDLSPGAKVIWPLIIAAHSANPRWQSAQIMIRWCHRMSSICTDRTAKEQQN